MTGYMTPVLILACLVLSPVTSGLRIDSIYPRLGSLAGGTTVSVYGAGFNTDMYNSFNLVFLGSIPCRVISYTVSANRLECVTEPYPDAVEGWSYPSLQSAVITDGQPFVSTGSNDAFTYHWSYTPQVWEVDPQSGPVGTQVEVGGYRFYWNYNNYDHFYVGNHVCKVRDTDSESNAYYGIRSKWPLLFVKCLTTEVRAGAWNASTTIHTGSRGTSWNHTQSLYPMYDWILAMYELYPDIHSVWPQVGSPSGGALLTISGTGFTGVKGDIEVDVDGIPCQVVSHTSTVITCWTGTPPDDSQAVSDINGQYPSTEQGYRFRGSRGVRVNQYRSIGGSALSSLHSSSKYPDNPDAVYSLPSFSTGSDFRRHGNYGERLMAFYNPHSSGRHSFFVSNDDGAEVWIGEGPNITNAYQNSILESPFTTGFMNYERYPYQRSEVISLDGDSDYILIGEFKEGGGAEYLTVGALLHDDTTYNYYQTKQARREEQMITLSSAGLHDIQTITVSVNRSAVNEDNPPNLVLEWGGRESNPIPILDLEEQPELVSDAILDLFSGQCEFDINHGINHYPGTNGYDFEGGIRSSEVWNAWNGVAPVITEEEALCGRHSLYVEDSRAWAFQVDDDSGLKTSDYPFLCLGYKLPPGQSMAVAIYVKDYGWYSIPLSGPDTGPFTFTVLANFFDDLYNEYSELIDDASWHYSCTDLQIMLIDNLPLEEGENPARFHEILQLGLYSNPDPERRGFFVDEVSLSSESRSLFNDSYVAPARPSGRSIHQVITTFTDQGDNNTLDMTINLELVPSDCVDDLPLIAVNHTGEGVLELDIERTQSASASLGGNYTLSHSGYTTVTLQYDATQDEIEAALEALPGVGDVTVSYDSTPLSHDILGNYCPGRSYSVRFETTPGDLPLLTVNEQYFTGDQVNTSVIETVTGGLFLRPIPGHMLQTVETTPQVHVRVRGQLAGCSGGHAVYEEVQTEDHADFCGFTYSPSTTPTVTTVTPTLATQGSTVTITGTGFSETTTDNFVTFGFIHCDVFSSSDTEISCVLGQGYGGTHELYLHVTSVGVATTGGTVLEYEVTVDSLDISSGSQAGGTSIVISGGGFYSDDLDFSSDALAYEYAQFSPGTACQNGTENMVTIDDNVCDIIDATSSAITCLTPEETGVSGTYDVTVSVGCHDDSSSYISATLTAGFMYDAALTPMVSGLTPASGGVHGGENVIISGTGFADNVSGVAVWIGSGECVVTSATSTEITCLTSAHAQGVWDVEVVIDGKGRAATSVTFTYEVAVSSISHCSGSVFGGQVLSIQGQRFGTDLNNVAVNVADRPCELTSLTDIEILCQTTTTVKTHSVNNNAEHPQYGLGYQWSPSTLTIHPGDTVQWTWTGSSFTARRGVAQVNMPGDTEYNGEGFRSGRSVTGSFSQTFTNPGVYYYVAEGFGHIGFNGTIIVSDIEDIPSSLSVTINSIQLDLSVLAPTCEQTSFPFTDYTYSAASTPSILSISPSQVSPGEMVEFTLIGLSDQAEDNILIFGGNTPLACSSTNPALVSTTRTTPETSTVTTGAVYSVVPTTVQCTVPTDIQLGRYRTILHVAGRGWASASLDDTTIVVTPRIDSSPTVSSLSLRGGEALTISTTGLLPSSVTNTRVVVGNTPCIVQSIASTGELTCLTQAAVDDGYSSVIGQNSPLAYWNLEGFQNSGSLGDSADATGNGWIETEQEGISGNAVTDQSASFQASYLSVPVLEEFSRPAGFAAEFWLKSDQDSDKYRIVFSSASFEDSLAQGYVVLVNPCNQVEFWIANGQTEMESSGSGLENLSPSCDIITDLSQCGTYCNGLLTVPKGSNLPAGTWHVISSEHSDWTDWGHVYIDWTVEEEQSNLYTLWSTEDCTVDSLCNGTQTLSINGEAITVSTTFLRSQDTQIEIGGTSILSTSSTNEVGDLAPFSGYLDEVAFYSRALSESDIQDRVFYGSSEEQPIWLSVEGINGVGSGAVPNVEYPEWSPAFTDEMVVDWDTVQDESYVLDNNTALRFEWTGLRSIREVSRSVYESCDLEASYIQEWTPPTNGGQRSVWLSSGKTHYFIDSVVGGCLAGRRISAQVGDVRTIEWRVGTYSDITITQGTGLLFEWDGSVMHDLVEMNTPILTAADCSKGAPGNRDTIGLVAKEWMSQPSTQAEVDISDLSVGPHYFMCSVGSHCSLGMRLTVNVMTGGEEEEEIEQGPVTHTIPWRIQYYDDFTIVEGETLSFTWEGFHSLHQVTEHVFESCDLSSPPLLEWSLPSVDTTVSIEGLTPGDYYYLCAVAGHCDAGMKIKVTVLPNDGLPVLERGVSAVCAPGVTCSLAYSVEATPQLTSVQPTETTGGSTITLTGNNLLPPGIAMGSTLSDVTVLVGNSPCTNVAALTTDSASDHMISCDVTDYESHYYHVDVLVNGRGSASVAPTQLAPGPLRDDAIPATFNSPYPKLFITSVASSVSPTSGSINGGTLVTVSGSGFSYISERNTIFLGGVPCAIMESGSSEIVCMTGAGSSTVALTGTVNGFPVSTSLMFEYSTASTPEVTSVSSSVGLDSLSGGESIELVGTLLGAGAADVRVQIVSTAENFVTADECSMDSHSIDGSNVVTVTCTVPTKPAGSYELLVHVNGYGFASVSDDTVGYALEVDSFTPTTGGYGGGVVLTVDGSGFPDSNEEITVTLCDGESYSTACVVTSSSLNQLECVLGPTEITSPFTTNTSCDITVSLGGQTVSVGTFEFSGSLTPRIDSIFPLIGGTGGGTNVTIEGEGLASLTTDSVSVSIDGVECEVTSSSNSVITCLTGNHTTTLQADILINVLGKGNALSLDGPVTYEYVDLWSSPFTWGGGPFTWGGGPLPAEGESVYIKSGQTVFLDISTPVLNLVLIEGSLIFQDEQDLHLQAKYIFINTGKLQVGTEESPFTHRGIITLHGSVTDPEIPIYGAKVLGIRQGELDLHGLPRAVTWTRLSQTALANDSSLRLEQAVDWVAGDKIVIAPTGKDGNETEENEVVSVSGDGRTVSLLTPLKYLHHGITDYFEDGQFIEIRAEVGLLSHNVIVQGSLPPLSDDEDTIDPEYGSQIFIHRTGPHSTPIRIEHTEIRYGGQAFKLGRYAVHFHLSGTMAGSYVRNCAIHHSNNRAITAHGVHDLLIEGNVAYDIKGHTFFVEDGIETNNQYLNNLGVLTRGSSSLLNTDQIPATFWITNPQNTFIGNAAAASRAYGFWYDLDPFPSGASRTHLVCPNKEPFGVFHNNTAHTCNEFGLRIWETYLPYADGCGGTNPQVANLTDFTTYANGINGVELSIVGHVRLVGFKVADNVQNGIEIIETRGHWGGPKVENTLVISHTSANTGEPQTGGIKTPNTPFLTISNVTFANFDLPTTSSLKACSHCKVRQGGFQVWFEGLSFIGGSDTHKTAFQWEWEVLYKDLDGTLTGLPGGGWVVPDSDLNPPQYCTTSQLEFSVNSTVINGTVCTNEINFLRMAWNRAQPLDTLEDVPVNVSNEFGNSSIPWRHYRLTHLDGYMFTMPDGYEHTLVWDTPLEHRVDHTSYDAGVYGVRPGSRLWVTHEFIQTPDHVNVGGHHEPTDHGTIPMEGDPQFSWHLENETDPSTVTYFITGQNLTDQNNNVTFHYSYEPCPRDGCPPPAVDYGPYESFQRLWSNNESWPSGEVPQEGEDVIIPSRWRMLLDVSPPTLGKVYILGELIFEDERDYNFTADLILIQGEMARVFIGTEDEPFTHNVVITLNGRRDDDPLALSRRLNFGSKGIGVFGNLTIHGQSRTTWTRLAVSASAGSDTLQLQSDNPSAPNWGAGDEIVIAPSGWEPAESEIRTITEYDRDSGTVTLNEPLLYDHMIQSFLEQSDIDNADPPIDGNPWWGDGGSMYPEVGLLTHNIVIQGGEDPSEPLEDHHYGCRILVGEYITGSLIFDGRLKIDSVEIRHCGQGGYYSPRDPRYAVAFANGFETSTGSYIRRCSVHHGYNTAIGVHSSYGIEISQNVIWRTVDSGLKVGGRHNVVMDNLAMLTSTIQPNRPLDNHAVDFPATFDVDGDNIVRGNAAAGSTRIAFRYAGEPCLEGNVAPTHSEAMFWDNTAHSGFIGLVVLGLPQDCTAIGGFTSTLQWNYGVFSSTASSLVATHLKIGVGKVGLNLNVFGPNPVAHLLGNKFITIQDSLIVGSLPGESCTTSSRPSFLPGGISFVPQDHQIGVMMSSFNQKRSKMDGTGAWHLMKGYPVIDGVINMERVSFAHFSGSDCNYNIIAIANNPLSPDAVHPIRMTGTNKLNVDLNNLVFFYEPNPDWIVQEDCIDMDCDGPKHALIRDDDGRFVSTLPTQGSIVPFAELRFANYSHRLPVTWLAQDREGSVLATPEEVLEHMGIARGEEDNLDSSAGGCEWIESWQGYRCKSLSHHMLVIESLDGDTETRRLSPLALNGGDTGAGHYTDLINGPMDHGWCTYYTCLKRLSTFFTVVAVGTDYCIWMTGSPPTQLRFHLLNADPDESISMCISFKDTRRKDVYKNKIFIEPENVQYLDGGGVQQTDGSYRPTRDQFGGANYFERESQILYLIVRGTDPIEIRTPPVVQVSLSLAVSLDDFFNVGELIRNLAFVLKIDPNMIRVVEIVSESSQGRRRRQTDTEMTMITLEFGDPPAPNITTTPPPTVAMEIMMAGETNDSVDLEDHTVKDTPLSGTNPFNEDPPETVDSFADSFNVSVVDYIDEIEVYEEVLAEVEEINELAGQVVDLVLTGDIANITNATVTGLTVVPATPPPVPSPPVIPPDYENATTEEGDPVVIPIEEVIEVPTTPPVTAGGNATDDETTSPINFVIPSDMRVTMEPLTVTGHLVHVAVTVFDDNGQPVINLGLVNPWTCQATLFTQLGDKDPNVPQLGGVTAVPFVNGVAEFTRLRVDRPSKDLTLQFHTIPSRFQATTSVSFQIVEPLKDTASDKIGFTLNGDSSALPSDDTNLNEAVLHGLSLAMDVDLSRIANLTVQVTSIGLEVEFDLLDRQSTDPPDVLGLEDTITVLMNALDANAFEVTISNTPFTGVHGSFEYVTPPIPTSTSILEEYRNLFIAVGASLALFLLITVGVVCCLVYTRGKKSKKDGKEDQQDGKIPLYPRKMQVTPIPLADDDRSESGHSGDHVSLFVRGPANERGTPSTGSDEDSYGGITDETSLGASDLGKSSKTAVDCWETPASTETHPPPLNPRRFAPPPQRQTNISIAGLANNPAYYSEKRQSQRPTPWAMPPSGNHGNQPTGYRPVNMFVVADQRKPKRPSHSKVPMSPGWD